MVLSNAIIVVSVFVCRQKCGVFLLDLTILLGARRRARKKARFRPQEDSLRLCRSLDPL